MTYHIEINYNLVKNYVLDNLKIYSSNESELNDINDDEIQ
jgi:hypothetical protein